MVWAQPVSNVLWQRLVLSGFSPSRARPISILLSPCSWSVCWLPSSHLQDAKMVVLPPVLCPRAMGEPVDGEVGDSARCS